MAGIALGTWVLAVGVLLWFVSLWAGIHWEGQRAELPYLESEPPAVHELQADGHAISSAFA